MSRVSGDAVVNPRPNAGGMQRLMSGRGARIDIKIDGEPVLAYAGETLHTVLMVSRGHVRHSEFGDGPRGGFCLMGACQDCWVNLQDGRRVRACATYVAPGIDVLLNPSP